MDAAKVAAQFKGDSSQPIPHASNIAFGFSGSIFEWMSTPEQAWRGKRVGTAMLQVNQTANAHIAEGNLSRTS